MSHVPISGGGTWWCLRSVPAHFIRGERAAPLPVAYTRTTSMMNAEIVEDWLTNADGARHLIYCGEEKRFQPLNREVSGAENSFDLFRTAANIAAPADPK
jgi:hypothetical protein